MPKSLSEGGGVLGLGGWQGAQFPPPAVPGAAANSPVPIGAVPGPAVCILGAGGVNLNPNKSKKQIKEEGNHHSEGGC